MDRIFRTIGIRISKLLTVTSKIIKAVKFLLREAVYYLPMFYGDEVNAMYQLVLCTCPDQQTATDIATKVIESRTAACVNILPGVTSVYQWQGEVILDQELQLVIKTTATNFTALNEQIIALHPYEVPEIIAIDIKDGSSSYLNWITASVN